MTKVYERVTIMSILAITFCVMFFATTYLTDYICWHNNFYQQGIDEERELFQ